MLCNLTAYHEYLRSLRLLPRYEVALGSPKFRDCRSLGICKIYACGILKRCNCETTVMANLTRDAQTGRLLMYLDTLTLDDAVRERHFKNGIFTIQQSLPVPDHLFAVLGLTGENYRIEAGNYPVLDLEDFLTVSLRMTEVMARELPLMLRAA